MAGLLLSQYRKLPSFIIFRPKLSYANLGAVMMTKLLRCKQIIFNPVPFCDKISFTIDF